MLDVHLGPYVHPLEDDLRELNKNRVILTESVEDDVEDGTNTASWLFTTR